MTCRLGRFQGLPPTIYAFGFFSSYSPSRNHISSSVFLTFILPVFPPICSTVRGLRRVTRPSISLHIGCRLSSVSTTTDGSVNLRSSVSSCFFLHSTDVNPDVPLLLPVVLSENVRFSQAIIFPQFADPRVVRERSPIWRRR